MKGNQVNIPELSAKSG